MLPSSRVCPMGGRTCSPVPVVPYEAACCLLTLDHRKDAREQLIAMDLPTRVKRAGLYCHPDKCREKGPKREEGLPSACMLWLNELRPFFSPEMSIEHQDCHLQQLPKIPITPFWSWNVTMHGEGGHLPLDDNFQSLIAPDSDPTAYIEDWNRVVMQKRRNRGRWDMLASMLECCRESKADIDDLTEMYQMTERKFQVTEQKLREANQKCDELKAQLTDKDEQLRSLRKDVESHKKWLGAREQQINKIKDVVLTSANGCTSEATHVESLGSLHGSSSTNETDAGTHNAASPAKQDHRSTIDTGDSPAARTRKRAQRSGNGGPSKRQKTGDGEDDRIVVE
ncbi:hypothetical protein KC353_g188 [Hortaea werneckii]|nr:hypothetical protein KC353_g188 [Hortaea werneckii]